MRFRLHVCHFERSGPKSAVLVFTSRTGPKQVRVLRSVVYGYGLDRWNSLCASWPYLCRRPFLVYLTENENFDVRQVALRSLREQMFTSTTLKSGSILPEDMRSLQSSSSKASLSEEGKYIGKRKTSLPLQPTFSRFWYNFSDGERLALHLFRARVHTRVKTFSLVVRLCDLVISSATH